MSVNIFEASTTFGYHGSVEVVSIKVVQPEDHRFWNEPAVDITHYYIPIIGSISLLLLTNQPLTHH